MLVVVVAVVVHERVAAVGIAVVEESMGLVVVTVFVDLVCVLIVAG